MIDCLNINQTINELLIAFDDCKQVKNEDLIKLVQLVSAVNVCQNGGVNYNTVLTQSIEPLTDTVITYPVNDFHAISVVIVNGEMIYNGVTMSSGYSINLELTTTNQQIFTFLAKAGSKILIERVVETI
jgi:hypothetical protein